MGKVNDPHNLLVGDIHPLLDMLISRWASLWFDIDIVSGGRSDAEQQALYAQGRSVPGKIVTNASTAALSPHGYRWIAEKRCFCAIDALPIPHPLGDSPGLMAMARVANNLGGITCGRNFKSLGDFDHFEVTGWRNYPYAGDSDGPPGPLLPAA